MSPARERTERRSTRLGELAPGGRGIVRRVSGDPRFLRRLMELGFVPGTQVELVRRAPMGDPIELKIRDTHFSIRSSEADRIYVDPV